jgi:hypothetical protein
MSGRAADIVTDRKARYRTAFALAAFALGLFVFTLYSGLK